MLQLLCISVHRSARRFGWPQTSLSDKQRKLNRPAVAIRRLRRRPAAPAAAPRAMRSRQWQTLLRELQYMYIKLHSYSYISARVGRNCLSPTPFGQGRADQLMTPPGYTRPLS